MARSFGASQTPAQRRSAQRKLSRQLKAGENPLGGEFRRIVERATLRIRRTLAHRNFKGRLGDYYGYNDETVKEAIWEIMTRPQIEWTIQADTEELRDRASAQENMAGILSYVILWHNAARNVYWYH